MDFRYYLVLAKLPAQGAQKLKQNPIKKSD